MHHDRVSDHRFFSAMAVVFVASATLTSMWSASMSAMSEMMMPGDWTMSMTWMRMPTQSWLEAAGLFLGMWVAMMVAMMLPSLVGALYRYRQLISGRAGARLNWLTAVVSLGYFLIWALCGMVVFPIGAAVAELEMHSPSLARLAPVLIGIVVLIAGAFQFTGWKSHQLAICRQTHLNGQYLPLCTKTALRYGIHLGLRCTYTCAGFTAVLAVIGVMDLRVMALVAAGITAERLAPNAKRAVQLNGIVGIVASVYLIASAVGTVK